MTQLAKLKAALAPIQMLENEPMARHTTFRVGGPCPLLLLPKSTDEFLFALDALRQSGAPYMVVGRGSNLLFCDAGTEKIIIRLPEHEEITAPAEDILLAPAGVSLSALALCAKEKSLAGLAFAAGIPGTVGGGVFMNAGAYGGELSSAIAYVDAVTPDGTQRRFCAAQCDFSYRKSYFSQHPGHVILRAAFALQKGDKQEIAAEMAALARKRRDKQPLSLASAGSTFKRPEGHFAAALIEQAGLKGTTVGGAAVSDKHAGFIVNTGDATAADILALIAQVQAVVFEKFGIMLEKEVLVIDQ